MGCLSLRVRSVIGGIKCAFKECTSTLCVKLKGEAGVLNILIKCVNDFLSVKLKSCNTSPSAVVHDSASHLTINAGLVCSVGLNMWEVFYVKEGPFIVEEGFFKVLKDK